MKLIVIVCCVLLSANLSAQQTAIEWFDKGNVALAAGENAKAVMAFTESLARDVQSPSDAYNNRGLAYMRLGQYEDAMNDFILGIRKNPRDFILWYNRGIIFAREERFADAEYCFRQSIVLNADFADAWKNLAASEYKQHKIEDAQKDCAKALEMNPGDEETMLLDKVIRENQ